MIQFCCLRHVLILHLLDRHKHGIELQLSLPVGDTVKVSPVILQPRHSLIIAVLDKGIVYQAGQQFLAALVIVMPVRDIQSSLKHILGLSILP